VLSFESAEGGGDDIGKGADNVRDVADNGDVEEILLEIFVLTVKCVKLRICSFHCVTI
jgi:hypothetical protein